MPSEVIAVMTQETNASETRRLIVNADDFGLSHGVNAGIIQAHEHGIVTSASLMVRASAPAAREAAEYARRRPQLSVGLHVDIGEWAIVAGEWKPIYEVVPASNAEAVAAELRRQLGIFQELLGRRPTHLDSHQHVHRQGPLRDAMLAAARELDIPLRHLDPRIQYCGAFYGQDARGAPHRATVAVEHLLKTLRALPPGTTELACHPAATDDLSQGMYRSERVVEFGTLCDPSIRAELDRENIRLCSFREIG